MNSQRAIYNSPRAKAWRLLEESRLIFNQQGSSPKYLAKTDDLFIHMQKYFLPPSRENYNADVREIKTLFKGDNFSSSTCSLATFSVVIVRHGMLNLKLPMISALQWIPFCHLMSQLIMTA